MVMGALIWRTRIFAHLQRFRRDCSGDSIATMFEPTPNIGKGDFGISPFQRLSEFAFRVGSDTTQFGFDFRDALFFGIQIRRVGGQAFQAGPRGLNQSDDREFFMGRDIIPDDDVAGAQLRDEEMLDISFERVTIQGSFNHQRSLYAAQGDGADDRDVAAPLFKAFVDDRALAARGACVRAGHIEMDAELVKEPEAACRERGL
jgi:hypothetical protein